MSYMEEDAGFFSQFVVGNFAEYLRVKRLNGVWGDDPEIQVQNDAIDSLSCPVFVNSPRSIKLQ